MSHHEKCGPHEVFVGNTERVGGSMTYLSERMRTVRLGDRALDIEGRPLPNSYAPIFIGRAEEQIYDAIMMERLRRSNRGAANA